MDESRGKWKSGTPRVAIAGGGTGGHLYPGIALAQEFQQRFDAKVMFIGTAYGIENRVLPGLPFAFKKVWMRGLQRKMSPANLLFPLRLVVSLAQSLWHLARFRPNVVIGTGGYASAPALLAAKALRIRTVIQEQNSYPGLVNRLLGNRVDQLHLTYEASRRYFAERPGVYVSGNPVRRGFQKADRSQARKKFGLRDGLVTLFVFGGSQGAHAINHAVLQAIQELMKLEKLQLLWATGPNDFPLVRDKTASAASRVSVHPFIEDMASAYAASDMVLCRAGATTLAEITVCGLPAILVPYPFATAGHQDFNARAMAEHGAAVVIPENELTPETLIAVVAELVSQPEKRARMAEAALKLARPNAAGEIVTRVMELLN